MSDLEDAVRNHIQYMANCCGRPSTAAAELEQLQTQEALSHLDKVQLIQVDEVLSRRPALDDFKTRHEKIERCISTAKQADRLRAELDDAKKVIEVYAVPLPGNHEHLLAAEYLAAFPKVEK